MRNVPHFEGGGGWTKVIYLHRNLHELSKKICHHIDPVKKQPLMLQQITLPTIYPSKSPSDATKFPNVIIKVHLKKKTL